MQPAIEDGNKESSGDGTEKTNPAVATALSRFVWIATQPSDPRASAISGRGDSCCRCNCPCHSSQGRCCAPQCRCCEGCASCNSNQQQQQQRHQCASKSVYVYESIPRDGWRASAPAADPYASDAMCACASCACATFVVIALLFSFGDAYGSGTVLIGYGWPSYTASATAAAWLLAFLVLVGLIIWASFYASPYYYGSSNEESARWGRFDSQRRGWYGSGAC